jgi:hypothetical protein
MIRELLEREMGVERESGSALPVNVFPTTTFPQFCPPGGPLKMPTPAPSPVRSPLRAEGSAWSIVLKQVKIRIPV